ncbi:CLUMA_CG000639, isoform A, partial [Clunio marinus]
MSLDNIHEELRIAEEQLRQRQQAQQVEMEQMELRRAQYINQIISANKVPDNIKLLPEFDGDSKKLKEWIDQVDDIVEGFRAFHQEPFWRDWLRKIRNKIIGKASDALNQNNTANNWDDIRETLREYFQDPRDLSTLCQGIPYLKQGYRSVLDFYKEVSELTAQINQKISAEPRYEGHTNAVTHFASQLTKNAFIDGLNYPYSALTRNANPATLVAAFRAAETQFMADARIRSKNTLAKKFSDSSKPAQSYNSYRLPGNSGIRYSDKSNFTSNNFTPNFK